VHRASAARYRIQIVACVLIVTTRSFISLAAAIAPNVVAAMNTQQLGCTGNPFARSMDVCAPALATACTNGCVPRYNCRGVLWSNRMRIDFKSGELAIPFRALVIWAGLLTGLIFPRLLGIPFSNVIATATFVVLGAMGGMLACALYVALGVTNNRPSDQATNVRRLLFAYGLIVTAGLLALPRWLPNVFAPTISDGAAKAIFAALGAGLGMTVCLVDWLLRRHRHHHLNDQTRTPGE
jgi:hypothetical protein